jgi:hypothetical protein
MSAPNSIEKVASHRNRQLLMKRDNWTENASHGQRMHAIDINCLLAETTLIVRQA